MSSLLARLQQIVFIHILQRTTSTVFGTFQLTILLNLYAITKFPTRSVVGCWDDESLDTQAVIAGVFETFHHPYDMSESSEIQTAMFNAADRWWAFKQLNHLHQTREAAAQ